MSDDAVVTTCVIGNVKISNVVVRAHLTDIGICYSDLRSVTFLST